MSFRFLLSKNSTLISSFFSKNEVLWKKKPVFSCQAVVLNISGLRIIEREEISLKDLIIRKQVFSKKAAKCLIFPYQKRVTNRRTIKGGIVLCQAKRTYNTETNQIWPGSRVVKSTPSFIGSADWCLFYKIHGNFENYFKEVDVREAQGWMVSFWDWRF